MKFIQKANDVQSKKKKPKMVLFVTFQDFVEYLIIATIRCVDGKKSMIEKIRFSGILK